MEYGTSERTYDSNSSALNLLKEESEISKNYCPINFCKMIQLSPFPNLYLFLKIIREVTYTPSKVLLPIYLVTYTPIKVKANSRSDVYSQKGSIN